MPTRTYQRPSLTVLARAYLTHGSWPKVGRALGVPADIARSVLLNSREWLDSPEHRAVTPYWAGRKPNYTTYAAYTRADQEAQRRFFARIVAEEANRDPDDLFV